MDGEPRPQELTQYIPQLRALARSLAKDSDEAEDLVQETLLTALQGSVQPVRSKVGWLKGILRHVSSRARRSHARRVWHERRAACLVDSLSTDPTTHDSNVVSQIQSVIMQLREPYRSTLMACYVEGMTPSEAAEHLGVPVATIYSRLSRGTKTVRVRLREIRVRGRQGWRSGLLVFWGDLLRRRRSRSRLQRSTGWSWAAGMFVISLGLAAFLLQRSVGKEGVTEASVARATEPFRKARASTRESTPRIEPMREAVATPPPAGNGLVGVREIRGTVVDGNGGSVEGVPVWLEEGHAAASLEREYFFQPEDADLVKGCETDERGQFSVSVSAEWSGRLFARGCGYQAATCCVLPEDADQNVTLVVEPTRELRGQVMSARGESVVDAVVSFVAPAECASQWRAEHPGAMVLRPSTVTDSHGRFEILDAYQSALPASLEVRSLDHRRISSQIRGPGDHPVELILPEVRGLGIRGRAMLEDRTPATHAIVGLGDSWVRADAEGAFEGTLESPSQTKTIRGWLPGKLPVSTTIEGGSGSVAEVLLAFSQDSLPLFGQVVDARGKPVAGAAIWLADPSPTGLASPSLFFSEDLISTQPVEFPRTRTDERGEFVLPDLLDRSYSVGVGDSRTLAIGWAAAGKPGSVPVHVVLDDSRLTSFRGCLRTRDGEVLVGARVQAVRPACQVPLPHGPTFVQFLEGPSVRTDSKGDFEFSNLHFHGGVLRVSGDGIFPTDVNLPDDSRQMEVVVPRAARLQLILGQRFAQVTHFKVRDEFGQSLPLFLAGENRSGVMHVRRGQAACEPGTIAVAMVPETVSELIVYGDEELLAVIPVVPLPGEITRVSID